jgi:SIR2-like domain
MLSSGLSRIAFTTNFDSIVEKAVAEVSGNSLSAYHIEGSRSAIQALNNEEFPFYCKLHGDFRYDSVKNLAADLATQNGELARGRRQSNSIRRRVARHARSQATIYAARARHSVNAIERLCL